MNYPGFRGKKVADSEESEISKITNKPFHSDQSVLDVNISSKTS